MIKCRRIALGLSFLLLLNCFVPLIKTQAIVNVGTLHVVESTTPVIDGHLDIVEWQDAIPLEITLFMFGDQLETMNIILYSMYDENDFLYIGAIIPDAGVTAEMFAVIFRSNESEPIFTDIAAPDFGNGHDIKGYDSITNATIDSLIIGGNLMDPDTDYGGTIDGDAKGYHNGTHLIAEMKMPLDSGDTLGQDIALDYGDTIDIWIYLYNGKEFTQLRDTDVDSDYCVLEVHTLAAPILEDFIPNPDPDGEVKVNWNNVPGATSYKVYRDTNPINSIGSLSPFDTTTASFYYDSGLTDGVTYYYVVVAVNVYCESDISNSKSVVFDSQATAGFMQILTTILSLIGVSTIVLIRKNKR